MAKTTNETGKLTDEQYEVQGAKRLKAALPSHPH